MIDFETYGVSDPAGGLFPGGVGNTQKNAERFMTLFDGVHDKLFGWLPDDTRAYPGHGGDTTPGAERPHAG